MEQFAAEELQKYLKMITGARFQIVEREVADLSSAWKTAPIILIGQNALSDRLNKEAGFVQDRDSILIRSFDKALLLGGSNPRSTLFSVYELLERMGCAWISPGPHGEKIPRLQSLDLPRQNVRHTASLAKRNIFLTDDLPTVLDIDWMAKQKLNHFEVYPTYRFDIWEKLKDGLVQEVAKRGMSIEVTDHSFAFWVPPRRFGKDHPEYFALVDGRRLIDRSQRPYGVDPPQLCVSNREVVRIVAKGMIEFFKANPEVGTLGLWSNDNVDYCQCDACVAMDGSGRPPARRFLIFANQVAELVSKEVSNRKLATLVTSAWIKNIPEVPKDIRPAPNLILWFTPINGCYRHSIADPACEINKSIKKYMEGWIGLFRPEQVGILEFYDADWGSRFSHPGYEPMTQRLSQDARYYTGTGIAGIYAWPGMGHSLFGFRGQHELTMNIFAQLAWNADTNLWEVVSRYCQAKFGQASRSMLEVYREIDKAIRDQTGNHTTAAAATLFSPEVWTRLEPHFSKALSAAADDTQVQGAVLEFQSQIRSGRFVYEMFHPTDP